MLVLMVAPSLGCGHFPVGPSEKGFPCPGVTFATPDQGHLERKCSQNDFVFQAELGTTRR